MRTLSMGLTRRRVALLAGAALATPAIARAQSAPVELKVSHFLPPNHTFQKQCLIWSDELEKASSGRLKLKMYPAGQLGPAPRQFDLARSGVADIAFGLSGVTPGRYPMTDLISEAYVTPAEGGSCAVMSRRLTSLYDQYLAAEYIGVKMLWMMVTSPLKFHTTKVALRRLEDFKGLRIRYAGEQFADIVTALGAMPLAVPPGETQDSLAKGIIDGATFPYEGAQSFDIGTVAKYTLEPGISTATFGAAMNPKKFDALPPDLAALITQSTGQAMATRFGAALDAAEGVGRDYMIAKGVTITTMPDDEMAKMRAAVAPLLAKRVAALEAQGKPAEAFHRAYVG